MATIEIKNLKLRTIIGINDWEREKKQDIIINVRLNFDAAKPSQSDNIQDTVDYKKLTKSIIQLAEGTKYFLIEKLAQEIVNLALLNPLVKNVWVRIDKPHALRFADSVAIELEQIAHQWIKSS